MPAPTFGVLRCVQGLNSMTGEEVLSLHSKLSVEEQQLFEGGRISTVCFDRWLQV